jgi:endonuclease-3
MSETTLLDLFIASYYYLLPLKQIGDLAMDEKERASKILAVLIKEFGAPELSSSVRDPFKALIRTILSQATNDRNRDRAYANLTKKYKIDPKELAEADIEEIQEAIRVGGLFRNKALKIKELSQTILECFHGSLDFVYSEALEKSRELLMSIPGVGPKTADVVLLFTANKPTVPVDTHINRVSRRLALAPMKSNYEGVRNALESLYTPNSYLTIHLLLISLGRKYCKARNPLHTPCPVNLLCPTAQREAVQPDLHQMHSARWQ